MAKRAEIKTKETSLSVSDFLNSIDDLQKRIDSLAIVQLMEEATGTPARMWGTSIIGFGNIVYKSPKTAREVDWFKIGFSPRKANLALYLVNLQLHAGALPRLGKHKTGAGCLYINRPTDVDINVLKEMISTAASAAGA